MQSQLFYPGEMKLPSIWCCKSAISYHVCSNKSAFTHLLKWQAYPGWITESCVRLNIWACQNLLEIDHLFSKSKQTHFSTKVIFAIMSYHKNQKYGLELRKYIPEDYEPVRQMFSNGIVEHAATAIFDGINGVKPKTRFLQQFICLGSYCGSVGRVVASNSRGPLFEYSHWQTFIFNIYYQLYSKDENKEKEAGNGPFFKKRLWKEMITYFLLNFWH